MTRLEAFAERVTREMLDAAGRASSGSFLPTDVEVSIAAARAVLEREMRGLLVNASVPLALAAWMATYLDEPAHPERG